LSSKIFFNKACPDRLSRFWRISTIFCSVFSSRVLLADKFSTYWNWNTVYEQHFHQYEKQCFFLFLEQNYLLVISKYSSFFYCKLFLDEFELLLLPEFILTIKLLTKKRYKIIGFLYVEPLNSEVNLYAEVKIYCKFVRGGNFYCKSVQRGKSLLVEIRTPNFGQLFISVQ